MKINRDQKTKDQKKKKKGGKKQLNWANQLYKFSFNSSRTLKISNHPNIPHN